MQTPNERILMLLKDIWRLIKAVNDEVDWYIASISEGDRMRRMVARVISDEKQRELTDLAGEMYEKYK